MTKSANREAFIPKSGEFFIMKSKAYQDPSIALRIPIGELLDGTKTSEELKYKYSRKILTESEMKSQTGSKSNTYGLQVDNGVNF